MQFLAVPFAAVGGRVTRGVINSTLADRITGHILRMDGLGTRSMGRPRSHQEPALPGVRLLGPLDPRGPYSVGAPARRPPGGARVVAMWRQQPPLSDPTRVISAHTEGGPS